MAFDSVCECGCNLRSCFCVYEHKCLSPWTGKSRTQLSHWHIIVIISFLFFLSLRLSFSFFCFFFWFCILLSPSLFCCSSQSCHKRPKSVRDVRVDGAPRGDGPPSALAVPQLVCAVDGQALQVVPAAAPASSPSGSWGHSSGLTLGELGFWTEAQEGGG